MLIRSSQMTRHVEHREYPGKNPMKVHRTFERRSVPGKQTRHTRDPVEQRRLDREFDQYSEDEEGKSGGCCVVM